MLQTYVLNGIPQDSVLGPLRLILFVNYRLDVVPSNILTFANDTKLYCEVNNEQQLSGVITTIPQISHVSRSTQRHGQLSYHKGKPQRTSPNK